MYIASMQPPTYCPRCGGNNQCGYTDDRPCWCAAEFSSLVPIPKEPQGCYCRRCLAELIEERLRPRDAT